MPKRLRKVIDRLSVARKGRSKDETSPSGEDSSRLDKANTFLGLPPEIRNVC